MKKYLLGVFAIALAIGFSAFTTTKSSSSKKTTSYFIHVEPKSGGGLQYVSAEATAWFTPESIDAASCDGDGDACQAQLDPSLFEVGTGANAGKVRLLNPNDDPESVSERITKTDL